MANLRFAPLAKADLKDIVKYTVRVWGQSQADRYLDSVQSHCHDLAQNPKLGRPFNELPNLRRSEHGKHVIFFRQTETGILVSRILHQSMLPGEHDLEQQP